MNRNNLWFLTLFSLILILGVYYITLPSEIFNSNKSSVTEEVSSKVDIDVSENNKLVALRVERDEKISSVMAELQDKIISSTNSDDKNSYFEELQVLNLAKGKEKYLENKLLNSLKINSYVEINGDIISVTIIQSDHNTSIANEIMKCIQEEFDEEKSITVKFTK